MSGSISLNVHIVGAGLLGTSIALRLKSLGASVSLEDLSAQNQALAEDLVGGRKLLTDPSLVIVSVPPMTASDAIVSALVRFPRSIVVDVTSLKTKVINDVKGLSEDCSRFIPTHPVAGREIGGPGSAQGDLFEGRPWIITPLSENNPKDLVAVEEFIVSMGAAPHRMDPATHDQLFARISHLPQIVSTLLARSLLEIESGVDLSGQGLRDVTRLADSDPQLWSQIAELNAENLLRSISDFKSLLNEMEKAISESDSQSLLSIFGDGQKGRKLISGKHGGKPRDYIHFRIVIDDRPGVLAQLFALCGEVRVNVEDLDLEHTPNQETGLITVAISPEHDQVFSSALLERGWRFHRMVGSI